LETDGDAGSRIADAVRGIGAGGRIADAVKGIGAGGRIADMAKSIGADKLVDASGSGRANFADVMLRALDQVSAVNTNASELAKQSVIDPESIDIQDLTIAQAQAAMSLNIAKNVLDRLVQDWREIINIR
jgi:flagellar hook-basal body complex protein FliE